MIRIYISLQIYKQEYANKHVIRNILILLSCNGKGIREPREHKIEQKNHI